MSQTQTQTLLSAGSLIVVDDGQPLVEVARALSDGQPLVEVARLAVAEIDGGTGEGMDEWEFTVGGGRTVGAGQVTEILERVADIDGIGGGQTEFVFGETMYFE